MSVLSALAVVAALVGVAYLGTQGAGLGFLFAVAIPYAATAVFLVGFTAKVLRWARAPVPYRIPTSCGQQTSLPWIRADRLESPPSAPWAAARLAGEVLLFRSLFRNTRASLTSSRHLVHQSDRWLWLGAMALHWSLLIVVLRHLRFFTEPTPGFVRMLERGDALFQLAVPALFLTDVVVVAALLYLLGRRLLNPVVRYVSLAADYLALWLLLGIAASGIAMRYFVKADLVAAKQLALGLVSFHPTLPDGISWLLYAHLLLVSALFAWFPFSKLMHLGGVFLSPTRNLPNDSRRRRHVSPGDVPVEVHTYTQWQAEFAEKLEAAGLPLDGDRE